MRRKRRTKKDGTPFFFELKTKGEFVPFNKLEANTMYVMVDEKELSYIKDKEKHWVHYSLVMPVRNSDKELGIGFYINELSVENGDFSTVTVESYRLNPLRILQKERLYSNPKTIVEEEYKGKLFLPIQKEQLIDDIVSLFPEIKLKKGYSRSFKLYDGYIYEFVPVEKYLNKVSFCNSGKVYRDKKGVPYRQLEDKVAYESFEGEYQLSDIARELSDDGFMYICRRCKENNTKEWEVLNSVGVPYIFNASCNLEEDHEDKPRFNYATIVYGDVCDCCRVCYTPGGVLSPPKFGGSPKSQFWAIEKYLSQKNKNRK